jgi:hypothetical protein
MMSLKHRSLATSGRLPAALLLLSAALSACAGGAANRAKDDGAAPPPAVAAAPSAAPSSAPASNDIPVFRPANPTQQSAGGSTAQNTQQQQQQPQQQGSAPASASSQPTVTTPRTGSDGLTYVPGQPDPPAAAPAPASGDKMNPNPQPLPPPPPPARGVAVSPAEAAKLELSPEEKSCTAQVTGDGALTAAIAKGIDKLPGVHPEYLFELGDCMAIATKSPAICRQLDKVVVPGQPTKGADDSPGKYCDTLQAAYLTVGGIARNSRPEVQRWAEGFVGNEVTVDDMLELAAAAQRDGRFPPELPASNLQGVREGSLNFLLGEKACSSIGKGPAREKCALMARALVAARSGNAKDCALGDFHCQALVNGASACQALDKRLTTAYCAAVQP